LRDDYDGADLRLLAKGTKNAAQARRLLALAGIYDGGSSTEVAQVGVDCIRWASSSIFL
jgi:hypothetical protein